MFSKRSTISPLYDILHKKKHRIPDLANLKSQVKYNHLSRVPISYGTLLCEVI